jgi:hypothetical protein
VSKHTKGPWVEFAPNICGVVDSEYRTIHGGDGNFRGGTGFELTGFIREPDAKLMASAPDLLEALRSFIDDDNNLTESERRAKAKAAIAKATT